MKISYMLKREDFYKINQETLDNFYIEHFKEKKLYIYPELNAIITDKPSKEVRNYLYVEYNIKGSLWKKVLVKTYIMMALHTKGMFAAKTCKIRGKFGNNCLIYPCNKKIRVFDFDKCQVRVIPKSGFPDNDIKKEIKFRKENRADFIPPIIVSEASQYTEKIIDGFPLARIKKDFEVKKNEARKIWRTYIRESIREIPLEEYSCILREKFNTLLEEENIKQKNINKNELKELENKLFSEINRSEKINIGMSHGDLQPGNIWVENGTGKIYIIDWESYGIRSIWYDECILDENLRMEKGLEMISKMEDLKHAVVLYEDLIFRLEELNNLPYDYNSNEFKRYVQIVLKGRGNV